MAQADSSAVVPTRGGRAERTRARILARAEALFATRGYDATRLEDVARAVGIRRASIIYYFPDKPSLYEAVLDEVFSELFARIEQVLQADAPLRARMESAISAWVRYVGGRPTFARLLLREAVNAVDGPSAHVLRHVRPFIELIARVRREHSGPPVLSHAIDPLHFAATIAGSTLFFVGAMPGLAPGLDALTDAEHIEAHRQEVLRITRRLLDPRGGPA